MVAAPSQTAIINRAAEMLGSQLRLQAISDNNALGLHARAAWDSVVTAAFADYPWSFAIARTWLNALAETPAFGAQFAYALPADCLRWLPPSVEDEDAYYDGQLESGKILTNFAAPLPVRYISSSSIGNVAIWPRYFVQAIESAMAAALAEPLTQSANKMQAMAEQADRDMRRAKRRDAQSKGNRPRHQMSAESNWAASRYRRFSMWRR